MELSNELQRAVSSALASERDIEVRAGAVSTREDAFLSIHAALVAKFGIPDFPGGLPEHDWRTELRLDSQLLAVWDFDYYQLSLRLEDDRILLRRHPLAA